MNKIEKINSWKATDGTVWECAMAAEKHQRELDFDEHYETNYCLGNYEGSRVNCRDMKEWLDENRTIVLAFLNR